MEQEYEIIEGVKYYMAPTNLFHYNASDHLSDAIKKRLDRSKYKLTADVALAPDGSNTMFPDVAVFEKGYKYTPTGTITSIPLFVAEIISPSSRRKDISVKPRTYEKLGVKEYWLVDPYGECITTFLYNETSCTLDYVNTYQKLSAEELEKMKDEPQNMSLSFIDTDINIKEIFPDED